MIDLRIRRLLKFTSPPQPGKTGLRRGAIKRSLSAPGKFARIFKITAAAYTAAVKVEKKEGQISQKQIQGMILKWAQDVLKVISIDIEIKGAPPEMNVPVLFVGNHLSYMDIPLLLASVPVVFVAKEEVSKWLVIGQAGKKAGTVFVKRESGQSRAHAAEAIAHTIMEKKRSIGVFPSGTTCLGENKPWRHGVFNIAHKHKIPVQPFRIRYEPLRKVAYIDKDTFATHLLGLLRLEKVKAFIEFDAVRLIDDPIPDCEAIRKWTREIFEKQHEL